MISNRERIEQENKEDAPYRNKHLYNWGVKTKIFISMPMAGKSK